MNKQDNTKSRKEDNCCSFDTVTNGSPKRDDHIDIDKEVAVAGVTLLVILNAARIQRMKL